MRLVFMGTPAAAIPSLQKLLENGHEIAAVYTQPDRPAGRGKKLTAPPIKEFAAGHDLPVYQPTRIKTAEAAEQFRSFGADAAIVVAYGRILPESFLSAFPRGAINVHFSLLPRFRGAAPVNWAIVHGESVTGVTTMQMDRGLDTGDILLQSETRIGENENAVELMDRLAVVGADLLSETLRRLDEIEPRRQNEAEATLAPIMKKEDGLISWMLDAAEISNRVRGFQPFPTAFTFYRDNKLTIRKACEISPPETPGEPFGSPGPGQVLKAGGGELLIACGAKTILSIDELQLQGKRSLPVRDFLNGTKMEVGEKLG